MKKPITLGFAVLFPVCVALAGCASSKNVVSLGNNTYAVTAEASTGFFRHPERLEARARADAAKFCESQGKVLKILSVTTGQPHFGGGFASSKVTFMALNPGDPALTAAPAPAESGEPAVVAPAAAPVAPTDVLYAELIKLNDLRQKGLITDEEYQAQKRKILARSN